MLKRAQNVNARHFEVDVKINLAPFGNNISNRNKQRNFIFCIFMHTDKPSYLEQWSKQLIFTHLFSHHKYTQVRRINNSICVKGLMRKFRWFLRCENYNVVKIVLFTPTGNKPWGKIVPCVLNHSKHLQSGRRKTFRNIFNNHFGFLS